MSTRGLLVVIKNGAVMVAEYNHCDSYPNCMGQYIKDFVQDKEKLNVLNNSICKCNFTDDDDKVDYDNIKHGYSILDEIISEKNENINLINNLEFCTNSLFCEYAYVINLDTKTVDFYRGFNVREDVNFGYFMEFEKNLDKDERYRTVRLVKTYKFNRIPTMRYINKLIEEV